MNDLLRAFSSEKLLRDLDKQRREEVGPSKDVVSGSLAGDRMRSLWSVNHTS